MTKSRNILAPRIQWTPEQKKALRDRYPHERTDNIARDLGIPLDRCYAKASSMELKKSPEYLASPAAGRTNGRQGIGTRFTAGHTSWNKGMKGLDIGGKETRFKKGCMSGAAQHNYVPIGSLRITDDGILQRKVTDDPTIVPTLRWTAVHRLMWIEANGPVPNGHIVAFKPGMRTNKLEEITPDRVELITRAENMRRNSYHNYPKEIAQLIQLRGALNRKINAMEKQHDQ